MNDRPIPEDQHDVAVERILQALGNAPVPEGLESRIATSLQTQIAVSTADRSASRTWWRGAAAGAAFATLAISAVLLLQHNSQTRGVHATSANGPLKLVPAGIPVSTTRAAQGQAPANPCASPSTPALRTHSCTSSLAPIEHADVPRPIATEPLTAEERSLVLLARRTDPKDLAILNPEARAKLDADDAAKFTEFFAPPPAPSPQSALPTTGESE